MGYLRAYQNQYHRESPHGHVETRRSSGHGSLPRAGQASAYRGAPCPEGFNGDGRLGSLILPPVAGEPRAARGELAAPCRPCATGGGTLGPRVKTAYRQRAVLHSGRQQLARGAPGTWTAAGVVRAQGLSGVQPGSLSLCPRPPFGPPDLTGEVL